VYLRDTVRATTRTVGVTDGKINGHAERAHRQQPPLPAATEFRNGRESQTTASRFRVCPLRIVLASSDHAPPWLPQSLKGTEQRAAVAARGC
jgi:hypothetical protein